MSNLLRKMALSAMVAGVFAPSATACTSFAPVVEEPLRVENVRDFDAQALGLVGGVSSADEARARLTEVGVTGVVQDAYAATDGAGTIEVVAADYQRRVHVFRAGKYAHSLTLPTHGVPPYGVALRLGEAGGKPLLVVLYRDPLARKTEPPALLAFSVAPDASLTLVARATLGDVVARHGGMTQPLLVGHDFDDGVMLVARDRDGSLWDQTYLLRFRGGAIESAPQPMTEALRCSCVRAYAVGASVAH